MLKLSEEKELTKDCAIKEANLPQRVNIPLIQHFGKPCDKILVGVGDVVKTGQMIATSDSGLFSPVHASISGKVLAIADFVHPLLGKAKAISIESDGKDEKYFSGLRSKEQVTALSKEELIKAVFDAGIVGLGGGAFPAHIKLNPPKPLDTFILNGAECEPYLNVDFRVMLDKTNELIAGIEVLAKILNFKHVYIAIEDNKREAIDKFRLSNLSES